MNEPAVRYQLRKLVNLGLIRKCLDSGDSLKPGRKSDLFRLSSSYESKTALQLCQAIMVNIEMVLPEKDPADILAGWFLNSMGQSPEKQVLLVKELVNWLNQKHYAANWLAGRSGPEILISNCPYCELQPGQDLLCRMDTAIISMLTGLSWKKEFHMESAFAGGTCRFVLNP
jgi:predicted ArsR family transcriptional regulator